MDWGKTNFNPLETWADRTRPNHYTQTRSQGASLEYMVQLSNLLAQDIWICIPAEADDEYVRNTARLLRDSVNDGLKIYVEYSNETWNGIFSQTSYVSDRGEALALDSNRWQAGHKYVSLRSVQIWKIFEEEFVVDSRLVKVLATQSSFAAVTEQRVDALNDPEINPDRVMPDALGIAPYFGVLYSADDIASGYPTIDEILDIASPEEIELVRQHVIQQKAIADTQGMQLVCYEGGQHFVGVGEATSDNTLTELLLTANRDPRMYSLYHDYLDMLMVEGVEVFAHWLYVGGYSQWGSWGALETQDQSLESAHKYRALLDWIAMQPVEEPETHSADLNKNGIIEVGELLRVVQLYYAAAYHCDDSQISEDGYATGAGSQECDTHSSDYRGAGEGPDWIVDLSELLRVIQLYQGGVYHVCEGSEDGFCMGIEKRQHSWKGL
jgi:hypothetical protein